MLTDGLYRLGGGTEIVERATNAGADVVLRPSEPMKAIGAREAAVRAGRVAESTVDRAVTRQLLHKERLGLFAERAVNVAEVEVIVGSPSHRAAAERMSRDK